MPVTETSISYNNNNNKSIILGSNFRCRNSLCVSSPTVLLFAMHRKLCQTFLAKQKTKPVWRLRPSFPLRSTVSNYTVCCNSLLHFNDVFSSKGEFRENHLGDSYSSFSMWMNSYPRFSYFSPDFSELCQYIESSYTAESTIKNPTHDHQRPLVRV